MNMGFELTIINGERKMQPVVIDGVDVEWTRQGAAGQMTFTVIKDAGISFSEGNAVTLVIDGKKVFRGYVLKKSRDKEHHINVTCMDSLFYLANNQTVAVIKKQKASEAIIKLCKEIGLKDTDDKTDKEFDIADTGFVIEKHLFNSATSYMDIIQTLLDITLAYTGKMFVLYDDFGVLRLKNIDDMKFTPRGALLVSGENAENFDYESTIENSYNEISLWQGSDNSEKNGEEAVLKEVAVEKDKTKYTAIVEDENGNKKTEVKEGANIANWGNLRYFEILDTKTTKENAKLKAKQLLELHNQVKRKLSIKNVFSDPTIRGGSSVVVDINLGDVAVKRWFMVESVKHHFANDYSTMDLELKSGKGFVV